MPAIGRRGVQQGAAPALGRRGGQVRGPLLLRLRTHDDDSARSEPSLPVAEAMTRRAVVVVGAAALLTGALLLPGTARPAGAISTTPTTIHCPAGPGTCSSGPPVPGLSCQVEQFPAAGIPR